MSNRKYLIIMSFLIFSLLCLGAVCASDDLNGTDVVEVSNQPVLNSSENLEISEYGSGDEVITGNSFEDIQNAVDNASDGATIKLEGTFKSNKKPITVEKSITIDGGKKTVLDADGLSGFFYFKGENNKVVLKGLTFINLPLNEIGIENYEFSSGSYAIENCIFKNNKESLVLCPHEKNTYRISNSDFTDNTRQCILATTLNIDNCNFNRNTGCIHPTTVTNCKFIKNTGTKYDGFISEAKSISNCYFEANTNSYQSFIISCNAISNSKFVKNTINGASLIEKAKSVTGSQFLDNTAKRVYQKDCSDYVGGFGGALSNVGTVDKCIFKNNKADMEGGAIYYVKTVKNCVFEKNSAFDAGAIAYADSVIGSDFTANKAIGYGGAIVGVKVLTKCKFKNNQAVGTVKRYPMHGGGAVVIYENAKISKCSFTGNKIKTSGSAIMIKTILNSVKVTISDSKFSKNKADGKFETSGYLFKNYAKGTIYNTGNHNLKISFKKCKGLKVKNTKKFKLKTKIKASVKKGTLTVKVQDKIYSNPIKGIKVKIKIGKKTISRKTDKTGMIKLSVKSRSGVKITCPETNFLLKSTKSL
jgi:hypothetical protein